MIYLAFISLGLPDALLGSSWTVMHLELGASVETAGVIAMIVSSGTIVSSLLTNRVVSKFGTGKVVVMSVAMTALALVLSSMASAVWILVFCGIPLGLGAGAIDAALNNFVALHYKPRHMNWLHCFWGVGAASGPLILAFIIGSEGTWRNGYMTVGVIQAVLVIALFVTLPLWKQFAKDRAEIHHEHGPVSNREAVRMKGVKYAMLTFFFYCSLEAGTGLWAASYLTTTRDILPATAAIWVSMYYGGITVGRFLSGIIADRIKGQVLIRGGLTIIACGVLILLLPLPSSACVVGLVLIGLGCAPIFPSMIHLTPERFGQKASQTVIGLSMASAYMGVMFMPPILGGVAAFLGLGMLPGALLLLTGGMFFTSEKLRHN
jgi:fucose permease